MEINEITGKVIHAAYTIHSEVGPGLLETFYERVLERMLVEQGLTVRRQVAMSFDFRGMRFNDMFTADLVVEGRVIVELKSQRILIPLNASQLRTYLRVMDLPVGLLINFGGETLREGLVRVANRRATGADSIPLTPLGTNESRR